MTNANHNCALCDLPVGKHPYMRHFAEEEKLFCCMGCMNVYSILLESGALGDGQNIRETELFKRSLALGLISTGNGGNSETSSGPRKGTSKIPPDTPSQEVIYQLSGMWCTSCAWLIEHALTQEPGVVSAEAFFTSDLVKVNYCPQYIPPDRLTKRLSELGYQASEYNGGENANAHKENRDLVLRLGIAGFLWLNIMTLSTALYVGYFEQIADSVRRGLPFLLMALATPVVFYSAMPILRLAWHGFLQRTVRMETLLALGILAAYVYSVVQAVRGFRGATDVHIYFDTASAIVTLVLLGKLIERNAKERTTRAITTLYQLMPKKVRLLSSGSERFVTIDALNLGDVFMVKAGERIPADGIVESGVSHTDESLLTGESSPVTKEIGDSVVAGSINVGGILHVRATQIGENTTLAQIIRMVEHALSSRTSLERTVDRISRVFVPAVVVVALLAFAGCWLGGYTTMGEAMLRAITVLVIACPCALGMATPLAVTAAIGTASRRGILVSDSLVLETIRRLDTVVFDKTGTITAGDFALLDYATTEMNAFSASNQAFAVGAGRVIPSFCTPYSAESQEATFKSFTLPKLAALERYSEHPLGKAVVRLAEESGVLLPEAREIEIHKGEGITGLVSGKHIFVGNRRLAAREASALDSTCAERALAWEKMGRTVAFFGWDNQVKGVLAFGDHIKPEATEVIESLRQRGIRTLLLSGDATATTAWVADSVGVDEFRAEVLPAGKVAVLEELQQQGQCVAMIGDGVNDAPALAQADLGIALGSGAEMAMKAAAIVLMKASLKRVIEAFDLSHRTWRIVRQNLFWAFFYNTLGISLAITGLLNPLIAAAAMLLSSLTVIGNSLRLNRD